MSKRKSQIVGTPVIGVTDGCKVGEISDLIINPCNKAVEFLLVDVEGQPTDDHMVIPFLIALGVGDYAVTIRDTGALLNTRRIPVIEGLRTNNVNLLGAQLLTERGRLLGQVHEYLVDPDTGRITDIVFLAQDTGQEQNMPIETIVSLGQQVVTAAEDAQPSADVPVVEDQTNVIDDEPAVDEDTSDEHAVDEPTLEENTVASDQPIAPPAPSEDPAEEATEQPQAPPNTSTDLFLERQRSFLIGKRVLRSITDANGELIIPANTVITDEIFDLVKQAGTTKVTELTNAAG